MWPELDFEALSREEHALSPVRTPDVVERIVVFVRLELYNRGQPCGAAALRRRQPEQYCLRPLPSLCRIGEILVRHGLTHGRIGRYESDEPCWLPASSRIPERERR